MCELWVPMLASSCYASRPTAGCLATLALPGPKGMRLCVIMSPSSGYFPVSPLFLKQPTLGVSASLQRRFSEQKLREMLAWRGSAGKRVWPKAGSEEWEKCYHK